MKRDPIFAAEQALRGDLFGWLNDLTEEDEAGCWIWQGGTANEGSCPVTSMPRAYPPKPGRAKIRPVARIVWEAYTFCAIPEGRVVWNSCANSMCVNPDHLRCTSRKEMIARQTAQGRHKRSVEVKRKMAAIVRARSGLTWDDVQAIRLFMAEIETIRVAPGFPRPNHPGRRESMEFLAQQYGVSYYVIKRIVGNESWRDPPANVNPFSQLLRIAA